MWRLFFCQYFLSNRTVITEVGLISTECILYRHIHVFHAEPLCFAQQSLCFHFLGGCWSHLTWFFISFFGHISQSQRLLSGYVQYILSSVNVTGERCPPTSQTYSHIHVNQKSTVNSLVNLWRCGVNLMFLCAKKRFDFNKRRNTTPCKPRQMKPFCCQQFFLWDS